MNYLWTTNNGTIELGVVVMPFGLLNRIYILYKDFDVEEYNKQKEEQRLRELEDL